MRIRSNVMIAIAMGLAVSSQVYAEDNEQAKGKKPPRPSFASIDANVDGEIDFDEFSLQELPHGDHQTVFSEIDTDSDGIVTKQEYQKHKPPRRPKRQ